MPCASRFSLRRPSPSLPLHLTHPLTHSYLRSCSYNIETIPHTRTYFDAAVGARDLWETYMPVFEACVQDGHGQSVMCSAWLHGGPSA